MKIEDVILKINQGSSMEELKNFKQQLFSDEIFKIFLCNNQTIFNCYSILSQVHDQFMKRALYYAQQTVIDEGSDILPVRFSWVSMGSGGRKEQTLDTDQDNGIIYIVENNQDQEQVRDFIQRFAELGVDYLNQIGYHVCQGNVMATNLRWQKSIEGWKQMIYSIGDVESREDIRYIHILADFRTIYGDERLEKELSNSMQQTIRSNNFLLERVAEYSLYYEIPLGLFGQIFTVRWGEHAGKFDLKYGAYVPWVNIIRWFSFYLGIKETNTLERMMIIHERGIFSKTEYEAFFESFSIILTLRFNHPDYYLDLSKLSKYKQNELKRVLKQLKKLRRRMKVIMRKIRRGGVYYE